MFSKTHFETHENPRITGKTQCNENFPVGSFLLSKKVRPLVGAFYRFARTADDIADDPVLESSTKLAKLDKICKTLKGVQGVQGPPPAEGGTRAAWDLTQLLQHGGFTVDQPRALLLAFRRDSLNADIQSWADLLDSCSLSANPVGRFLLEIHHETTHAALRASDALCTALQVLNHLQDCHKDYTALNRVYVPTDWLAAEGLDRRILGERLAPPGLLRVFEHMLKKVEALLTVARHLPESIAGRHFRLESAVIVALARRLMRRLRRQDLLAHFHGLKYWDWIVATTMGLATGLRGQICSSHGTVASDIEEDFF